MDADEYVILRGRKLRKFRIFPYQAARLSPRVRGSRSLKRLVRVE